MAGIEDFGDLLTQVQAEWNKAETTIKVAEQIGDQVVFPAIKELRYAGRRLIDALTLLRADGDNKAQIQSLLDDALFDCYRARHDAVDATISIIAVETKLAAKKLGYDPVLRAFPRYPDFFKALREAQEKISSSRSKRAEREVVYNSIESVDLPKIVEFYNDFRGSQEMMRSLARQNRRWPLIGVALTVFGLVLSAVSIYVAYLALK